MFPDEDDIAESADLQADEKFYLREPRDILQVLRSMIEKRALITAYIPGSLSTSTAILGVDEDTETLMIDGSPNDTINARMVQASHVLCVSQLDRVRVQFRLSGLRRISNDGYAAFEAPLPDSLLQLQRRDLYRLQIPVSQPVICTIPLPGQNGSPVETDVRVLDISAGGIAIAIPDGDPRFKPGSRFESCLLALPDARPIEVSLTVTNLHRQENRNGIVSARAGCQFGRLPRGAETVIQQYIFRIDRQRSARERGNF